MKGIGAIFVKKYVAIVGYIEQNLPMQNLSLVRGDVFVGKDIDELTVKDVMDWYDEKFKKFCDSEGVNFKKLAPEDRYIIRKKFWNKFPKYTVDIKCPTLFAKVVIE